MQHFSILAGLLFPLSAFAQTFTDTYTTSNGWVAINPVSTTIQGGSFNFNGTYCGGVDDYKFKPLGFTLSNAKWTLDFEWTAQSGTTTGPSALIASLTSETSDPECNTWPNDITNNNTISVLYNSCFGCGSSDYGIEMITKAGAGTYVWHQALHIPLPAQQTGYIRCERVSSTLGRISVFADAARTVHLPGSPACFPIDQNIVNLKYLQHGAWVPGDNSRALWGSLDNTVVENNINHTTPTALTATINSTGSLCGNSTVQLQASGGSNYQWSNGTVGAINTVSQGSATGKRYAYYFHRTYWQYLRFHSFYIDGTRWRNELFVEQRRNRFYATRINASYLYRHGDKCDWLHGYCYYIGYFFYTYQSQYFCNK
jgi:hypothetical protein